MTGRPAYTDADVEAAKDALGEVLWETSGFASSMGEIQARAVLDAVAPAIAARALRSEATRIRRMADRGADGEATPYETADYLCIRADEIEAGPRWPTSHE